MFLGEILYLFLINIKFYLQIALQMEGAGGTSKKIDDCLKIPQRFSLSLKQWLMVRTVLMYT